MANFTQLSTNEVQKSSIISQFIYHYELGSRRPPSTNELRQLQEELERISSRAATRSAQLHSNQRHVKTKLADGISDLANKKRSNKEYMQPDDTASVTSTPTVHPPANKRVRSNPPTSSRVGGSDSEHSTKTTTIRSGVDGHGVKGSISNGGNNSSSNNLSTDGKHFQKDSYEKSPAPSLPPKAKHSSGTPVQDDFSRVKVTNQVQIQTFWASLEPYFRSISDEDIAMLENGTENQDAFIMPKLGKFYAHTWAEEEVSHFPDHMNNNKTRHTVKHLLNAETRPKSGTGALVSGTDISDSDLSLNTARLAPLTERIISALVAERLLLKEGKGDSGNIVKAEVDGVEIDDTNGPGYVSDSESSEVDGDAESRRLLSGSETISLEDRLRRELQYIGILDEQDINWDNREDDEICVAIRSLQRQLRDQARINRLRKERLLLVAKEHIGYQEYTQVIDELDKQVEQSYLKRHRLTKSRKRKSAPVKTVALSDNALNAMDRRRRVIQAIGHLFPAEKFALPTESMFNDLPDNPEVNLS
ncbi:histone acetyltransferases subunit 3-domain-containing protein [Coemansia spiralis]|nr:histone acetyltransferases subunit 3-domain-containing protein [Coemansia spiralis]